MFKPQASAARKVLQSAPDPMRQKRWPPCYSHEHRERACGMAPVFFFSGVACVRVTC